MVKTRKIIVAMMVMMLVIAVLGNVCMAYTSAQMLTQAKNMATAGATGTGANAVTSVTNIGKASITIVRVVAAGVAVAMLVVVAMKYMTAAPGDRADIKKHAVVYVVGAIIMFSVTGILGIVEKFAGSIGS